MTPAGFAAQGRAFPTFPNFRVDAPSPLPGSGTRYWNPAYYENVGPGQIWSPMRVGSGDLYDTAVRRLALAYRTLPTGAPSAEVEQTFSVPYGAVPATGLSGLGQTSVLTPAEMVVDIDPSTGFPAVVASDGPGTGLVDTSTMELSPFVSNRPLPSITATARGDEVPVGCWTESGKGWLLVLAIAAGLFLGKGAKR